MIKQQTASLQPGTYNRAVAESQSGFLTVQKIFQRRKFSTALSGEAGLAQNKSKVSNRILEMLTH